MGPLHTPYHFSYTIKLCEIFSKHNSALFTLSQLMEKLTSLQQIIIIYTLVKEERHTVQLDIKELSVKLAS